MANFFERIGRVEVVTGDTVVINTNGGSLSVNAMKEYDSLDFKFKCKKVADMTSTDSNAEVSILGLSRESVQELATYKPRGLEMARQRRIRVYASYRDFGDNLIFDGDIVEAVPSMPPENWITIQAFVGNYRHEKLYSHSINEEITVKQLIENVAQVLGLKALFHLNGEKDEQDELQRKIKTFDCSGTQHDLMTMINRVSDFVVYEDCGILHAIMADGEGALNKRNSGVEISEDSGMIGIPKILVGSAKSGEESLKLEVKSLINPSIQMWSRVSLKSVYFPGINGEYTVQQIEYNGHLRGNEWYMTVILQSPEVK